MIFKSDLKLIPSQDLYARNLSGFKGCPPFQYFSPLDIGISLGFTYRGEEGPNQSELQAFGMN